MMAAEKKTAISKDEQFEIASTLHAMFLDALFRETDWMATDAVFHGGTSLALARNSIRFSEDLDFMITPQALGALTYAMAKIAGRIDLSMSMAYPGGKVILKGPKGDDVVKWELKWEHPNKHGKVMVKAEFFVTKPELLARYRSTHLVPTSRGIVAVRTPIPVPELVSSWADKIKAIATRPDFKWRDAFDLALIIGMIDKADLRAKGDKDLIGTPENKIAALEATAGIYDKSIDDVAEGLDRVLQSGALDDVKSYEKDMFRWFPDADFPRFKTTGMFERTLAETKREIELTVELIDNMRREMKP
jgi:hypothetical protein